MKNLFLICAIFLSYFYLLADNVLGQEMYFPRDYSVMPPSPEVASLMKFEETPVSCFSGTPNISIPIHTVKQGNISVPITLNYHGGGIRVTELEGNAGIGWTLNAGGCVSRTVNGHPDEINSSPNRAKGLLLITANDKEFRRRIISKDANYDIQSKDAYVQNRPWLATMGEGYVKGVTDMANDVFNISAVGLSGTFIYNDSHQLIFQGDRHLNIQPSHVFGDYPATFVIKDNSGTEYHFGRREMTKYKYPYGYPNNQTEDSVYYASAWHLTKIKNIQNDSIVFHYTTKVKKLQRGDYGESRALINNPRLSHAVPHDISYNGSFVTYYPEALTAIETNSEIVRFYYSSSSSYPQATVPDQIASITICRNEDNQTPIRTYNFNYVRNDVSTYSDLNYLFLSSISENNLVRYSFEYYIGDETVEHSYLESQDFGGYNNCKPNTELIPTINQYNHPGSADRSVNPQTCFLGSLKSISYPTGGKTEFRWEAHDYGYMGNQKITEISESPIGAQVTSVITDTLSGLMPPNPRKLAIDNFRIGPNTILYLDLSKYFLFNPDLLWGSEYYWDHESMTNPQYPRVVFTKDEQGLNPETHTYYIDHKTISETYHNKAIPVYLSANVDYTVELLDPTNVYGAKSDIEARFTNPDTDCGKIFISRISTTGTNQSGGMEKDFWPGVRIASISSIADEQSDTIVKEYYYTNNNPVTTSFGVISSLPDYDSYFYYGTWHNELVGDDGADVYTYHSDGLHSSTTGQQTVEYPRVYEQYRIKNQIDVSGGSVPHSIEYLYSAQDDFANMDYNGTKFLDYQPSGAQRWTSKAHWRGNLLEKTLRGGTGSWRVRTKYDYNIFEKEQLDTFTTDLFRIADFSTAATGLNGYAYDYSIGVYHLIPYTKTIRREITLDGSLTDNKHLADTVDYTYFYDTYTDNLDFDLVRSKRWKDSEGRLAETFYTYRAVGGNYIDQPVTEVTVIGGKIVAGRRMKYGTDNRLDSIFTLNQAGISVTNQMHIGDKDASSALRSVINDPEFSYSYDSNGLLTEIRYRGTVLASYLWGYKGIYPIVEAEGIPYAQLSAAATSAGHSPQNLWWTTSSETLKTLYSALRSSFQGKNLTTMTYHWLIGVSEAIDSRGVTTQFTYDDFGRLRNVKDYNGYFITKYVYKYKNEQ